MSTQHTTREVDDPQAPEELRAALRSARADGPSAARLARMREATLERAAGAATAAVGAGAPEAAGASAIGSGAGASLPTTTTTGWAGKLLLVGALVGAGVGAWLWRPAPAAQPPEPVAAPAPAAPAVAPPPPPRADTPVEPEARTEPGALDEPGPAAPEAREAQSNPRPRRRAVRRARDRTPPSPPRSLTEEIALLGRARRALQDQPAETQRLTEEHSRLFPRGRFVQEREVLAVHALLRQGDLDAALQRGRQFLQTYPESTHARRVATLLEDATR